MIVPVRGENGYRLYDSNRLCQLEQILEFRDAGYSIEDIQYFFTPGGDSFRYMSQKLSEISKEIVKLKNQQTKLNDLEHFYLEFAMYKRCAHIYEDFKVCIGCAKQKEHLDNPYYIRKMRQFRNDRECGGMELVESYPYTALHAILKYESRCKVCKEKGMENWISYPKVFRGIVKYEGYEYIKNSIQGVYEQAQNMGYDLKEDVYCFMLYSLVEKEKYLDIMIPSIEETA